MTKKLTLALLTLTLGFISTPHTTYAANTPVTVTIDGTRQNYNPPPQIIDGRTMLPLRAVCESLDITVTYNPTTQTARMEKGNQLIIHQIGTPNISINGKQQSFDTPSTIISDRTLVPLRMLAEAIGADVDWNQNTRTAAITTDTSQGLSQLAASQQTIINLDGKTSVVLEDVIARIGAQEVLNNADVVFNESEKMVPLSKLAANYAPYDANIVGAEILYNTAKSYIEALYNVDYTTVNADEWWKKIDPHFNSSYRSGSDLDKTGRQMLDLLVTSVKEQEIKMTSIFVSDPSLVYTVNKSLANLDSRGNNKGGHSPWAVRGSLYFKFDSYKAGTPGRQFWNAEDGEDKGGWFRADVEIRLGINDRVTPHKATTTFDEHWIDSNCIPVK